MARILILSSEVACGHVGLSAGQPVLQRLGHSVTGLPTIMLSNHPGFAHVAGDRVPVERLRAMVDALADNGWLGAHDAVQTGYLPSPEHVDFACELIDRMRALRPGLRVIVDPVLGDDPGGLYVSQDTAMTMRESLISRADIVTPNRFEAEWLGHVLNQTARVVETSARAGARFGALDRSADGATFYPVAKQANVPQGTGDMLAALIAADVPLGQALGYLQSLIAASLGAPHLAIAEAHDIWTRATALKGEPHGL
ncbi:bifunctional hydroxymethylpyrimidine kinase/phosphomethylpyrimidine kinase [Sagittula sp. NFXS13]|uniref:bifunctional hydroxymethylpyrimidine kinase/phosphomethylpyrimidine kinase n=1 Tax=Sagittula sp. NFXS13 TaxID=2819095 RepID=UPI0032DFFA2A